MVAGRADAAIPADPSQISQVSNSCGGTSQLCGVSCVDGAWIGQVDVVDRSRKMTAQLADVAERHDVLAELLLHQRIELLDVGGAEAKVDGVSQAKVLAVQRLRRRNRSALVCV